LIFITRKTFAPLIEVGATYIHILQAQQELLHDDIRAWRTEFGTGSMLKVESGEDE